AVAAVTGLLTLRREALLPLPGRAVDLHAGVRPRCRVVLLLTRIPAREESVEVLGVAEALVDDHRRVRVVPHVFVEDEVVREDVVDEAAEEGDVRAGTDLDPVSRHRGRPGEAWIDAEH